MAFTLPAYTPPDFSQPAFRNRPLAAFAPAPTDGVAPDNYHGTTVFPEYFQLAPGQWSLAPCSRMDCVTVRAADGTLAATEFRRLSQGDQVALGRTENGEEGIYVHTTGFLAPGQSAEKFGFRGNLTRETAFSIDYDQLYDLLDHERDHGRIIWVMGPAAVFDLDARNALCAIIKAGYVHGLLAGNALATHDIEGAIFGTALGQELYRKNSVPLGHYKHLDALNTVRRAGSIQAAMDAGHITNGVMHALVTAGIPYVLAGSIRDDGPLPEVIANVYEAQSAMRALVREATTVIALATQLHTIATGNMTPSFTVAADKSVRPVYFYSVDMSEFAINKLADRGSLMARSILTNVQDFLVNLERNLRKRRA
ncbi:MAG: hypothetical protein AB7E47_17865 [Desulfovibrionaceae bacterium]